MAAFLQKGLAKNLQAPLWRGRVLQSDKENAGAKHIAHPQSPARVDTERCYLRPVRCKSAGGTGRPQSADGAGTHDAQAGSGIDDRKARPPPPRAGRRTRLLCGHGICDAGWRHEVRCGGKRSVRQIDRLSDTIVLIVAFLRQDVKKSVSFLGKL